MIPCPYCDNEGFTVEPDRNTGEPTQVQCQFCYETPDSVFTQIAKLRAELVECKLLYSIMSNACVKALNERDAERKALELAAAYTAQFVNMTVKELCELYRKKARGK